MNDDEHYKKILDLIARNQRSHVQVLNQDFQVVYANDALRADRAANGNLQSRKDFGVLIHPDDRGEVLRRLGPVMRGNIRSVEMRLRILQADGSYNWFLGMADQLHDESGFTGLVSVTALDIQEQVKAENRALEQERKLREAEIAAARFDADQQLGALLGQTVVGVVHTDLQGVIQEVNPAICAMSGYTREQLLGRSLLEFADSQEQVPIQEIDKAASRGQVPSESFIRKFRHADGNTFSVAGQVALIRNAQGEVTGTVRFVVDVTQQMQAEQALAESEAKYRLITDNQTDYVQLVHPSGKVLYDSPSLIRLLGEAYTLERQLGEAGVTLIHPDDREIVADSFAKLIAKGEEQRVEVRWVLPTGELHWVEVRCTPIPGADGKAEQVLAVSRDITDRKLAEQQREAALEQASFANEAKSQFLAKVSHELRTPLNAVIGYGYLLGNTGLDTHQSEHLERITASSKHLLGLIRDVLDLSRIEAGQQSVTPAPFALDELLANSLDAVRPAAQASGIELGCDDTGHLPQQLIGDAGLIKQALLNFLSNAVKFTERGQVWLQVRALADGPATGGSSHLRFEVHDTGAGIAPDRLGELFQPFAQLRADKRGTGLGLDITRRIVELMGGEVGVESTLGQGSCFWFTVPLQRDTRQSTPQAQPIAPQAAEPSPVEAATQALRTRHAGKPILVAEDDIISQRLMRLMLQAVGLKVEIAEDGAQALELAKAGRYALVLMDRQMPQMDGIETTRAIRQLPGWQQVPIVALTADVFTETREACLKAGMSEFLGKPVEADKLYSLLLRILETEQASSMRGGAGDAQP